MSTEASGPSPAEAYARFRETQATPLLAEFAAHYGFVVRRLPTRGLRVRRSRLRRAGRRPDRRRQDDRRRVRGLPGAAAGPKVLLHNPDQGTVQPEVRRPRRAARRVQRRPADRRLLDQLRGAGGGDDHRGAPQHAVRGLGHPARARLRGDGRGALPGRPLPRRGLGRGDHRAGRVDPGDRAVSHREQRRGVRRLAGRGPRRDGHRGLRAPAGAALPARAGRQPAVRPVRRRRADRGGERGADPEGGCQPGPAADRPGRVAAGPRRLPPTTGTERQGTASGQLRKRLVRGRKPQRRRPGRPGRLGRARARRARAGRAGPGRAQFGAIRLRCRRVRPALVRHRRIGWTRLRRQRLGPGRGRPRLPGTVGRWPELVGRRPVDDGRGAGSGRPVAGHRLHLLPGRLRRRGEPAARLRDDPDQQAGTRRDRRDPRPAHREPGRRRPAGAALRRIRRGAVPRHRRAPRRDAAGLQGVRRGGLRSRPGEGRLRHRDAGTGDQHAGPERGDREAGEIQRRDPCRHHSGGVHPADRSGRSAGDRRRGTRGRALAGRAGPAGAGRTGLAPDVPAAVVVRTDVQHGGEPGRQPRPGAGEDAAGAVLRAVPVGPVGGRHRPWGGPQRARGRRVLGGGGVRPRRFRRVRPATDPDRRSGSRSVAGSAG